MNRLRKISRKNPFTIASKKNKILRNKFEENTRK
jgi:hypothetical protein